MKKLLLLGGLLAMPALIAELIITSFNQNGDLTWTNSAATNAAPVS